MPGAGKSNGSLSDFTTLEDWILHGKDNYRAA
jgi:hypothetical protein